MTYPSKVDWWLAALILVGPLSPPLLAFFLASDAEDGLDRLKVILPFVAGTFVLLLALAYPVRYTITPEELVVRSGLRRWRIPLAAIVQVSPTSDPRSSPALSLDRLRVDRSDGGEILISPRDKHAFLDELAARSGMKRSGDRLERAEGGVFTQALL